MKKIKKSCFLIAYFLLADNKANKVNSVAFWKVLSVIGRRRNGAG